MLPAWSAHVARNKKYKELKQTNANVHLIRCRQSSTNQKN